MSSINALIDLAISNTNSAYASSGVTQRLRLVYRGEVAYTENSSKETVELNMEEDLINVRDGSVPTVHALRDQYGADFVSLLTERPSPSPCGIAYVMQRVSASSASDAFNVTAWNCAAGNLSLAHELGHNMGLAHDFVNSGGPGAYSYAYGYRDPGFFRTIMSYGCEPQGLQRCDRTARFSTPYSTYNGRGDGGRERLGKRQGVERNRPDHREFPEGGGHLHVLDQPRDGEPR
ncbi:MAG TPA: M12 family metallo-peptidase [Gemmatimonadaceae bacterium]|nr:M12 family metallo-peptidase [Gemmatimonadaceae bacterium]